ncbi:MAG: TRAP transporter small permease [Peptococcaceae bacterium]|nr:TRAP transporter small permease [Peptococcaceae bacterium]
MKIKDQELPIRAKGLKGKMRRVVKAIDTVVEWIGAYMMVIMVAIVAYQVFARYVLRNTPAWSEEVALLFMTAYGFLSIGTGLGRRCHLSVTIIYDRAPAWLRPWLDRLSDVLSIGFGLLLLIEGYKFTVLTWSSQLPATGLPNGLGYVAVPVTGLVIIISGLKWLFVGEEEG